MSAPLNRFINNLLRHQRAAKEGGMDRRAFLRACLIGGAVLPFIKPLEVLSGSTLRSGWTCAPAQHLYSPEFIRLVKDLASLYPPTAAKAREQLTELVTTPIMEALDRGPTFSSLYAGVPISAEWMPVTNSLEDTL